MIGRFEFILAILIPAVLEGTVIALARRRNAKRLPPGSHVAESNDRKNGAKAPGTRWSRYGGLVGHWISDFSIMGLVIIYILYFVAPWIDLWSYVSPLVVDLPVWMSWVGVFGVWFLDAWNAATLSYNMNFTACTKAMKSKYVLATGGPYRLVRHPVYLSESLGTIFALLATGIWVNVFGVISWLALNSQAKSEEVLLEKRFGKVYTEYKARTGRFFPRIRHQTRAQRIH
jgi:protein-S-isoprenylcysteine O-methyltransferase Ste14